MTRDEIIEQEMEGIRIDIVRRYQYLGMKASGQFSDETTVELQGRKNKILAPSYARQLVKGRRPGTQPPISAIESWIRAKGIRPIESNMKISSLAFIIARSIKEKGTTYFQQGGTDLLDAVITPERMQRIINRLKEFTIVDLTTKIERQFAEIAK